MNKESMDRRGFLKGAGVAAAMGTAGAMAAVAHAEEAPSDALQVLLAKDQIREKLVQYCRSMDRIDRELGYNVFTEDSHLIYGNYFDGTGREFIDWVCDFHATVVWTSHNVMNETIRVDGDTAGSETYIIGCIRLLDAEGNMMEQAIHGRYLDKWVCIDGEWFVKERLFALDFNDTHAITEHTEHDYGRRDTTDPSYEVLASAGK